MPYAILYLLFPLLNKYIAYFYIAYLIGYCKHFSLIKETQPETEGVTKQSPQPDWDQTQDYLC